MQKDRSERYQTLVDACKACRLCADAGLINASEIRGGELDSAQISPWTGWLSDLNARVIVVGQDWGDQRAFENQRGCDSPKSATNQMLRKLMASIGIDVPEVGPGKSSGVFLTNAVLCFRRQDGCQGPVQARWFDNCGTQFLRPQIELINPQVVVCLGERAYGAVLAAYHLPRVASWRAAVEGPGVPLAGGPVAFAVYHCGRRVLNTHRKAHEQFNDWKRIGEAMARTSHS